MWVKLADHGVRDRCGFLADSERLGPEVLSDPVKCQRGPLDLLIEDDKAQIISVGDHIYADLSQLSLFGVASASVGLRLCYAALIVGVARQDSSTYEVQVFTLCVYGRD